MRFEYDKEANALYIYLSDAADEDIEAIRRGEHDHDL